jgi:hypothetical protein
MLYGGYAAITTEQNEHMRMRNWAGCQEKLGEGREKKRLL